jgi:hypothetical protein
MSDGRKTDLFAPFDVATARAMIGDVKGAKAQGKT